MAECKVCEKTLNREASEIGSWCIGCIKNMSDTNTCNMAAKRDDIKKEKLLIMIFAAIGAVGGIVFGAAMGEGMAPETIVSITGGIWGWGGFGAGLGFFISKLKVPSAERNLGAGLVFIVFGIIGGVFFFLFLILRRNKWIKKFDRIIAGENAAIAELEGYTLGKEISMPDLSRKVGIIAGNFELANDGVSVNDLKQLKIVQ